jgi:hypothetical protein
MKFDLKKIYEDEFISIDVDENLRFIQAVWLQHPDSNAFRRCFMQAAEITLTHHCRLWLSDSRAVHYLEFADQNWILDHMAPLLGNSCLTKFARINSAEGLALLDMDRILHGLEISPHVKSDLELAVFMEEQGALNWLFQEAELRQEPYAKKQVEAQLLSGLINIG